jgi:opacity protein-like surface antigen
MCGDSFSISALIAYGLYQRRKRAWMEDSKTFCTWLIGLEPDFDARGINESTNNIQTSLPWFGTTRLRAGFLPTPAWLIYVTDGVACGSAQITAPLARVNLSGVGWAAGGGVEYAFGNARKRLGVKHPWRYEGMD